MLTVFTIGSKRTYDRDLRTSAQVSKVGREEDYAGGIIWLARSDAEGYLNSQSKPRHVDFGRGPVLCDVYGVRVQNLQEVSGPDDPLNPSGARCLLRDSPLFLLDDGATNEETTPPPEAPLHPQAGSRGVTGTERNR